MKFISLLPAYLARWDHCDDEWIFCVGGCEMIMSEVPAVKHYSVMQETKPFEYAALYRGTNKEEAEKALAQGQRSAKSKMEISLGLPDGGFSIDRARRKNSLQIVAHDNDANGLLLAASILGTYGFEEKSDGEVIRTHTSPNSVGSRDSCYIALAVLKPGNSLTLCCSTMKNGSLAIEFSWDGRLLSEKIIRNANSAKLAGTGPGSQWSTLDQIKLDDR